MSTLAHAARVALRVEQAHGIAEFLRIEVRRDCWHDGLFIEVSPDVIRDQDGAPWSPVYDDLIEFDWRVYTVGYDGTRTCVTEADEATKAVVP